MFPNPTSELAPPTGAVLSLPAWANRYNAGASAYAGNWVRRIVSAAGGGRYQEAAPVIIPCIPGERFYFEAMVSERVAVNTSTRGYILARFFDSTGTVISTTPDLDIRHIGGTAWTKFSVTTPEAPAGAVSVHFAYGVDCTAGVVVGETYWWDALFAKRMTQPQTIDMVNYLVRSMSGTVDTLSITGVNGLGSSATVIAQAIASSGSPPTTAFVVKELTWGATSIFIQTLSAPGSGNSVSWQFSIIRLA